MQHIEAGQEASALCTILAVLLARHLRFDAADPAWPDRDRVVLAAGVAGLGQAATDLLGSGAEIFHRPDQSLGVAAGLAMADRMLAGRFGRSLVDHRSWHLGGQAELATGAVQEAAFLAGKWRLGRLTAIVAVQSPETAGLAGFAASNWAVRRIDADDVACIESALSAAARSFKPTLIACIAQMEAACPQQDDPSWDWEAAGRRDAGVRRAWLKRLARHASRQDFERVMHGPPARSGPPPNRSLNCAPEHGRAASTTEAVQQALLDLSAGRPELAALPGESAWSASHALSASDCAGQTYEALMQSGSAAIVGLALHGGLVPFAVYRLASFSFIQPALTDAAREGLRLLLVLIEPATPCSVNCRLSSLRAMRNVAVYRPAGLSEALACLELALLQTGGPSVLLLSDEPAPAPSTPAPTRLARGGYVVAEAAGIRDATLVASGPEIRLALEVRARLVTLGVQVAVVSLPSWSLFSAQGTAWTADILGQAPRIGMEPGSGFGWERWLSQDGLFIELLPGHRPAALAETICCHLERLRTS